jgi:hypothetical protein
MAKIKTISDFLSDLSGNQDRMNRWVKDRDEAMSDTDLSADHKATLKRGNLQELQQAVSAEPQKGPVNVYFWVR